MLLLPILLALAIAIGQTDAKLSPSEAKQLCIQRTGLVDSDLADYRARNEG
jgi:hypothetical protein